jgi:hypothetical protein
MRKSAIVTMGLVIVIGLLSAAFPVAAQTAQGELLNWPSEARFVPALFTAQDAVVQTAGRAALDWPSEVRFVSTVAVALNK